MNKAKRDMIIILVAIAVLGGALYFWLYFQPSRNRQAELETRIQARESELSTRETQARQRIAEFNILTEQRAALEQEWEAASEALPDEFDDAEVLRHIQNVVYPHTDEIHLNFGVSELREGDELYSTIVHLEFTTSYWQLLSILYNLVQGDLGNRVVTYHLSVSPLEPDEFFERMEYMLRGERPEDYMPMHIIEQFSEGFAARFWYGDEEVEIPQLHLIDVEMEIEYLSLHPGLLPEAALREIWALIDEPEDAY